MIEWLLDDTEWRLPNEEDKELFLKQCGLLLFNHYRHQLYEYLKKLDVKYPNVVNKAVFTAIERISNAIPGAHASELWLYEAVDSTLKDFSVMSERKMREKVAKYVGLLKEYDNSVQWTLFMPDSVKQQQQGFKVDTFEYKKMPALRFIGREDEALSDIEVRKKLFCVLGAMDEYKSAIEYDVLFMHHYGLGADVEPWHGVWGRFMMADTPVPQGFLSFDFVPNREGKAGPPYISQFAYATFSGDMEAMHKHEGYDSDAMYDVTRNIMLGQGVNIPYPDKYWTAEVFLDGSDKYSTAYMFSAEL